MRRSAVTNVDTNADARRVDMRAPGFYPSVVELAPSSHRVRRRSSNSRVTSPCKLLVRWAEIIFRFYAHTLSDSLGRLVDRWTHRSPVAIVSRHTHLHAGRRRRVGLSLARHGGAPPVRGAPGSCPGHRSGEWATARPDPRAEPGPRDRIRLCRWAGLLDLWAVQAGPYP